MKAELSIAQHFILTYAHERTDGKIVEFPENLKGGARQKVLESLCNKALITRAGTDWFIAAEGYEALGVPRKAPISVPVLDAAIADTERQEAAKALIKISIEGKPRTRDNSKQALVISMLKRPEGATIAQIMDATGWMANTIRGTFAGSFKKKLGLAITSDKLEGGERTYRIVL